MNRFFDDIIRDEGRGAGVGLVKIVLWILSLVYGATVALRNYVYDAGILRPKRLPRPVISIGNITVGGSGKTPLTIWLVKHLLAQGYRPAILTRGYRSSEDQADNDEVRMIREVCPDVPIIVGKNRYAQAQAFLATHDADVFVMDDGFQHRRLWRDFDLVAVDSLRGFGNRQLLPRGILREYLAGLKRADAVILTKTELNADGENVILNDLKSNGVEKPLVYSRQVVAGLHHLNQGARQDAAWLNQRDVVMMSSIADPKAFEETLKRQGARIIERLLYPDHYDYRSEDVEQAVALCRSRGVAAIVTTHKDAVKIKNLSSTIAPDVDVWVLMIDIHVKDEGNVLGQRIYQLLRA